MSQLLSELIDAANATVSEHGQTMTQLDQAIGDGDHGTNMTRGFNEIAKLKDEIIALPPAEAFKKIGMALVMKVGGASGPLYGSFFMDIGKAVPADAPNDIASFDLKTAALMVDAGVEAVKRRGKSDAGAKTMLDVLIPAANALRDGIDAGHDDVGSRVIAAAAHGLHATSKMKATRGRASFLGDRSIDHLDPGAYSSAMLIASLVNCIEQHQINQAS